jgi:hypothetical protein
VVKAVGAPPGHVRLSPSTESLTLVCVAVLKTVEGNTSGGSNPSGSSDDCNRSERDTAGRTRRAGLDTFAIISMSSSQLVKAAR